MKKGKKKQTILGKSIKYINFVYFMLLLCMYAGNLGKSKRRKNMTETEKVNPVCVPETSLRLVGKGRIVHGEKFIEELINANLVRLTMA